MEIKNIHVRQMALFVILSVTVEMSAADSIDVRGFWMRYSKPKKVAYDQDLLRRDSIADSKSVRFIYDVDFYSYFDNREYNGTYQIPQTIFNFRLAPELGVRILDPAGGRHSLVAGVSYTQRLGGCWGDTRFDPTAFYHYSNKGVNLQFGAVPYVRRIRPLPNFLMYDSIGYYRPNIQGALFSYQGDKGYVEFMCDWRGAQTQERREMFNIVVDGRYDYKWLNLGGFAQLNHKASFKYPNHEGVGDDIYLSPELGFDFSYLVQVIDSFSVKFGYVVGMQRDREAENVFYPQGFTADLYFNWWFLGIHNSFYMGDCMQPLRTKWGSDINQGDPFYQSKIYNRTDLFVYIYRNSFVNCYFSYNLHYDGISLQHQQQLIARFLLSGMKSKKPLRNIFEK